MKRSSPLDSMTLLCSALADPTRLRLLNLMAAGELCVCFLVEVLEANQPKISRHLAYLRKAGIVAARRDGKWMHYRIVRPIDPHAEGLLREALAWLATDPEMGAERGRLQAVCCAPKLPAHLEGAPRPAALAAPAASSCCIPGPDLTPG